MEITHEEATAAVMLGGLLFVLLWLFLAMKRLIKDLRTKAKERGGKRWHR